MLGPTMGSSDSIAMMTPQNTGARKPRTQNNTAAQRTLHQAHEQRPFEGRTGHCGEPTEECLLTPIPHAASRS